MNRTSYRNMLAVGMLLAGSGLVLWSAWSFVANNFPQWIGRAGDASATAAAHARAQAPVRYDVRQITSAHLFGVTKKVAAAAEKAPETKLRLTLFGVLASPQDRYARAMIQVASNEVKVYAVGDAIEGTDAALHKIEPNRVILDRKGALESLAMTRERASVVEANGAGPDSKQMTPETLQERMEKARNSSDARGSRRPSLASPDERLMGGGMRSLLSMG